MLVDDATVAGVAPSCRALLMAARTKMMLDRNCDSILQMPSSSIGTNAQRDVPTR